MTRLPGVLILLGVAGCTPGSARTELVPSSPFIGPSAPQAQKQVASPATEEASVRVLQVGQKLLAGNPQLGLKPFFSTIGTSSAGPPAEEIFHTGSNQIVITETLVRKCTTDGQLAALLCVELAKMAGEREQNPGPPSRLDNSGPPPDVPVGGDARGTFGPADGTRAVELAKYDRAHHRGFHVAEDPKTQARVYLTRAGFQAGDLDTALPLLSTAEHNNKLEKQMTRPVAP